MDHILAQPYYGDKKIRFYNALNPVASSPLYTLDIGADINSNFGAGFGPNNVVVHNTKIFVAVANDDGDKGGVLIYNYSDIYPAKKAISPVVLKFGIANGLSAAGMAINPANGDLYVPTFYLASSPSSGGVYIFTAGSNYTTQIHFSDFDNDASVAEVCANLAFDGKGNLWMTTWTPPKPPDFVNDPSQHFLICYKGLNKNTFYKITNTATKSYTATDIAGSTINVHLLSAPEGIAFDPAGNLWLGNNNDFALTNNAGEGTLVKINAGGINSILAGATGTLTVPATEVDIKHIPSGKLGGIEFEGTNIYINDQGQNQGSNFTTNGTVWKWDVNTLFNSANFVASGIHTTYPGNGGGSFIQPFIYIQDNATDDGIEPNTKITQPWQSLDIWVRKSAKGKVAGNDVTEDVTGGQTGFVYVRVRNKGMMTSNGTESLKLYWAKASAGLFWPAPWDGSVVDAGTGKTMGGLLAQETLPQIPSGESYIADFSAAGWKTPNPNDYTATDGHFCLLARIESAAAYPFGMTFPEVTNQVVKNALNNNRIAWRNIHIVNPVTNMIKVGGGVIAANYSDKAMKAQLTFELLNADGELMELGTGKLLITAKGAALEKLNQTDYNRNVIENMGNGVFSVLDMRRGVENIDLQPGEMLNLNIAYVLGEDVTGGALRVIQNEQDGGATNLIGGQTFIYGKVKGFTDEKPQCRKHSWLWLLVAAIILALASLVGIKKMKKKKKK